MNSGTDALFDLARLGWDDDREVEFAPHATAGLVPGRVSTQLRGVHLVATPRGEVRAEAAGRLWQESGAEGHPVVGDWVALEPGAGTVTIQAVLERRTAVARKAAGAATVEQVLAANVDIVFVVAGLDVEPNLRRLERFLAAAWDSGAQPVVALTKADLAPQVPLAVAEAEAVAAGAAVHAVSVVTGEGVDELRSYLAGNRTGAFLGPSGAGKSTLVNRLLGTEEQETQDVRSDGKGRHTTTHREPFVLPGGGLFVDTPGLRELGLWGDGEGAASAFGEITELAAECRFNDCAHESEPGCAVLAAVESGRLDPERLASYRKLGNELQFLARKQDARASAEERRRRRRLERSFKKPSDGPWTG
ncbi:MAG: ribosome small subunit-dependent GTPase A [Gaiellaceae bacterium]